MTNLIHNLYCMVDEWVDRQSINDPKLKELSDCQDALQEEIIRRLGEDGREMMETLADLSLKLEDIHDEALFHAAMGLGTRIAQPGCGCGWPGASAAKPGAAGLGPPYETALGYGALESCFCARPQTGRSL